MDPKLIVEITIAALNCGIFGVCLRFLADWAKIIDRLDAMWLTYCREHKIPFNPIGRGREVNGE